jgi:biotin carboxyl carrier protein
MRLASVLLCLIVAASFLMFAVQQTEAASGHQTEVASSVSGAAAPSPTAPARKGTVHKAIDEAAEKVTSPFAGLVSSTNSQWASEGLKLLLTLAIYGFGLGYLARVIRVRV